MPYLFVAYDPLGNQIILEERRYLDHIKYRHPELVAVDIQRAVESPEFITVDKEDALVNLYYRTTEYGRQGSKDVGIIKIAVRFRSDVGEVVSAYSVRGLKKVTEEVIWQKR